MGNNSEISIVVPVFNREKLIHPTLQSLKLQTLYNWECIIVDDYSTDHTFSTIEKIIKGDERFKLIQKTTEPKGAPAARNLGWRNASSDHIVFLDSDDLLAPWCLEERLKFLESNPNLDFCLNTNVEFKEGNRKHIKTRSDYMCVNPIINFLSFQTAWQTTSVTWKKTFIKKIGGWNENALSWQDGEIHVRALISTDNFMWGSKTPDHFLRTGVDGSISKNTSDEKLKNYFSTLNLIYHELPHDNLKKYFGENIHILLFNEIEKVQSYSKAVELIKTTEFETLANIFSNSSLLIKYAKTYHETKKIPIIRSLVYRKRNHFGTYPKRKSFFRKYDLKISELNELKYRLSDISLYSGQIPWIKA